MGFGRWEFWSCFHARRSVRTAAAVSDDVLGFEILCRGVHLKFTTLQYSCWRRDPIWNAETASATSSEPRSTHALSVAISAIWECSPEAPARVLRAARGASTCLVRSNGRRDGRIGRRAASYRPFNFDQAGRACSPSHVPRQSQSAVRRNSSTRPLR